MLTLTERETDFRDNISARVVEQVTAALAQAKPAPDPAPTDLAIYELKDPVNAALHQWSVTRDKANQTLKKADVVVFGENGSVDVVSREDIVRQDQEIAKQNQPALAGVVGQLDGALGAGIPWGSVLIGAVPGAVAGEIIDGFVSPRNADGSVSFFNLVVKGGTAALSMQVLPQLIGKRASTFFAGALALQVLADFLPLDRIVNASVDGIKNLFGGFGGGGGVVDQANKVVQEAEAAQGPLPRTFDQIF